MRVSCNGEQVLETVNVASNITHCRERWSNDFNIIKFINGSEHDSKVDTASDFYRQYSNGKYQEQFLNNLWCICRSFDNNHLNIIISIKSVRITLKITLYSIVCRRLPESWDRVKTETEFPVDTGTTITVSCQEGYINTGSKIVTCNTELYQDFQYETVPTCNRNIEKTSKTDRLFVNL